MNRLLRRYPSPSLVVSIIALIVALGGAGNSATGGNFILGRGNTADARTTLGTNFNGMALAITNLNTSASSVALALFSGAGRPPFTVDSSVKVANLNSDKLDGLDSAQFTRSMVIPYNLASRASSTPIALPTNRAVFVMGNNTTGAGGVGQATLMRLPGKGIQWIGLEFGSPARITSGGSSALGTHIVFLDSSRSIDIEVNNANSIRIFNGSATAQSGYVTLTW